MRIKKLIYYVIFSLVSFTFSLEGFSQTQSTTRTNYLENLVNVERQIAAFETKIAWVTNDPVEDSIAKAEGWYDMMNLNLAKFENQIVLMRIEQLKDYYNNILSFPLPELDIQNSIIPEMSIMRNDIAADYPIFEEYFPTSENSITALEKWIKEFPVQYENFTAYLETLVLTHLQ